MELKQKIQDLIKDMPENKLAEVIDFIEFLKEKQLKEDLGLMSDIFNENRKAMEELKE